MLRAVPTRAPCAARALRALPCVTGHGRVFSDEAAAPAKVYGNLADKDRICEFGFVAPPHRVSRPTRSVGC